MARRTIGEESAAAGRIHIRREIAGLVKKRMNATSGFNAYQLLKSRTNSASFWPIRSIIVGAFLGRRELR